MNGLSTPHLIAAGVTALYGVISLTGGIIGYVKANSLISLLAGGVAGILLLLCAAGIFRQVPGSAVGGGVVGLALLGRFAAKLSQEREQLGEFLGTTGGITAVVMVAGGALVLILSIIAMLMPPGPPSAP
jgi:uncharacterized membrane protein (UPF0136 family)